MPAKDIIVEIGVRIPQGQGQVDRVSKVSYRIPGNGILGLALADAGKLKIGNAVEILGDLLDRDGSDL